jgi:hypothetical protein
MAETLPFVPPHAFLHTFVRMCRIHERRHIMISVFMHNDSMMLFRMPQQGPIDEIFVQPLLGFVKWYIFVYSMYYSSYLTLGERASEI